MTQADAIHLIKTAAIDRDRPSNWVDLDCGSGTFTRALASLLAPGSTIYAVDQSRQTFPTPPTIDLQFIQADFTGDLSLPPLDGILMANSLHYVKDKKMLIERLKRNFARTPQFLIVEYDTMNANPWVPYPIDYDHLKALFASAGLHQAVRTAEHPSIYGTVVMYASSIS